MARREGGRAGRSIPGLASALAARARRLDGAFCLARSGRCLWCSMVADLGAGRSVTMEGSQVWPALFDLGRGDEWDELAHDRARYVVTGDRLERATT